MANPLKAIGVILGANTPVTDLVSSRIYHKRLPQKPTYPAIMYHKVVGVPLPDHDGATKNFRIRVQINCYGTSEEASNVYDAALAALDNVAKGPYGGISVIGVQYVSDGLGYDPDTKVDREIFDVMFFFEK